ncbi:hypothetical protein K3G63_05135 [Hymenobacter sp. HSC-4F20]|uniref:DUF6000 family protein n=1 Tax=Hymenobacter sp. HSC-4F20 TaxID=2864135 RepID=UPI001C7375D4|nr:DUF6000 family protein [Hymenobacter sp. HSC-4F20]MBX0289810.1 hypothetical protein [Hymenobacter sp. HSC-4F20]
MSFTKLWQKLFNHADEATELALHVAGATVRHRNPFEKLEAYRNEEEITEEFIEKWVIPFYMTSINRLDSQTLENFILASMEITSDITMQLLGDFDWRPRITGAYFAAIKCYDEVKDIIGVHLLKSEVCYAGSGYALALAMYNDERSKDYLKMYLDYYLTRKDLWFDQADVLAALHIISPNEAANYIDMWEAYIADKHKPNTRLDDAIKVMKQSMDAVFEIRQHLV